MHLLKNRLNILLILILLFSLGAVYYLGDQYKQASATEYFTKQISSLAESTIGEVETLIEEKKKATLTIALSIAQNDRLKNLLTDKNIEPGSLMNLQDFSLALWEQAGFKNIWIQVLDRNGVSLARSWTEKKGDDLSLIRAEVRNMINKPEPKATISVGKFDMSFKVMVPVFDDNREFIGIVEIITHFNSIAKKIDQKGFKTVVVVDKKFKERLKFPFNGTFIGDYYIANNNADQDILKSIEKLGIENFLNKKTKYYISKELNSVVIQYTIFEEDYKIMATFLIFKPLSSINLQQINNIKSNTNLSMLLAALIILFLLYFISSKERSIISASPTMELNYIILTTVAFIAMSAVFYYVVKYDFDEKIKSYLKIYTANVTRDYKIVYDNHKTLADFLYETIIETKDLSRLLTGLERKNIKDANREKLYNLFKKEYETFKKYGVRQFHFYLPDNESFLRFHRPGFYGDNLTKIRSTVQRVNSEQKRVHGFEEGRAYSGYRNVYPIFYKDKTGSRKHLGSVEISFGAFAFINDFAKSRSAKVDFLISKEAVNKKVFSFEKSNYSPSGFKDFYHDKNVLRKLLLEFSHLNIESMSSTKRQELNDRICKGAPFSMESRDKASIFSVIPVKNPITKKVVAAIILQFDDPYILNQLYFFYFILGGGILFILVVLLFISREIRTKRIFQLLSKKTEKIINTQSSIIVLTDGDLIQEANNRLLEFSGYKDIESFKKDHDCICDLFETDENRDYLQKTVNGERWIDYILKNPMLTHEAKMTAEDGTKHIFKVAVASFDAKEQTLVATTLTDITGEVNYQDTLKKEVNQAVEKLRQQNRIIMENTKKAAMGEMIGVIAHQLKQPLNAISLSASLLQEDMEYGELTKETMDGTHEIMQKNIQFMASSIDDYRNFFNPNKKPTNFKVAHSIDKALKMVHVQFSSKGITIESSLDEDITVSGFPNDLQQVVLNILTNAKDVLLEKKPNRPLIKISVERKEDEAVIKISDNGGGIDDNVLPNIFDSYFSTKGEQGTGIGLNLAKMIIEDSMKGKITAYNEKDGAVFEIKLLSINSRI